LQSKYVFDVAGDVFVKKEANKQKKKKLKYAEQKALGWGNVIVDMVLFHFLALMSKEYCSIKLSAMNTQFLRWL
jgi:hypothetical protein